MFCVLEYARSQSKKTVQQAFVKEFSKQLPTVMQIWTWYKKLNDYSCLCRIELSGRPKTSEEMVNRVCKKIVFVKNCVMPKEIVIKIKSGNPDATNNCLACNEEALDNETLQATTRSGHTDRGQAKAQTELTCALSQAEHILNM